MIICSFMFDQFLSLNSTYHTTYHLLAAEGHHCKHVAIQLPANALNPFVRAGDLVFL